MKHLLILDYGHRNTTPGKRTNCLDRVIHERTFNEGYGAVVARLARAAGIEVLEVAPGVNVSMNENADLNARVAKANRWYKEKCAQYGSGNVVCWYLSCHANAGGGKGAEVWVWSASKQGGKEIGAAQAVIDSLCAATNMKNRGVKKGYPGAPYSDFAVNRNTLMLSMLIENGFMDYAPEADLMDKPDYWEKCGKAVFDGWCKYVGIATAPEQPASETGKALYTVGTQLGAFSSPEAAAEYAAELKAKGAIVMTGEKVTK